MAASAAPQLVSVVVPALDEAEALPRCLAALAAQDGPFELVVADGGSRDATVAIARSAGARVVAAPRGRGPQQNAGAAAARGALLWFLHADAVAPPGALAAIRRALAGPGVAAGAFRLAFAGASPALRAVAWGARARSRALRLPYGDQGLFTTRAHFDAVGGFEEIPLFEDVRLVRALRRRGRLALLDLPLTVSARRYARHGVLRTIAAHARLLVLERVGVPPARLALLRDAGAARPRPHDGDEALLLFARWPEPGRAKTRLAPRLGAAGAAEAYRAVATAVAAAAAALDRARLRRVALLEPAERAADGARWLGPAFEVAPQAPGDLGARLRAGFAAAFARGAARVVAIGADCPGITAALLARAFDALRAHDAVVGPARDGGYWLIGFSGAVPAGAFDGIPWSDPATLATTRARLAGLRVADLPTLRDLDTPEDLDALAPAYPDLLAPFTSQTEARPS